MGKKRKKPKKIKLKSLGRNIKKFKRELKHTTPDMELLHKFNLPKLISLEDLASFLNIDVYCLVKYCVAQKKVTPQEFYYRRFKLQKKSGGVRVILAPKKELKHIQDKIHNEILKKIEPGPFAHGFRENFSIVTNAKIHLNAQIIYNLDLKNFFPSIKYNHVLNVFLSIGYSGLIASLLSALYTIPPRRYLVKKKQWLLRKSTYYYSRYHYVPQGAPTSPYLSNLVCFNLDNKLNQVASDFGFRYSRYADDLTFSSSEVNIISPELRKKINIIVKKEGFRINWKKEKFARRFKQRRVAGIIINKRDISIPRPWIRRLRAALHELKVMNLNTDDPNYLNLVKNIEGRCAYAMMVNKEKYMHFYEEFKRITM